MTKRVTNSKAVESYQFHKRWTFCVSRLQSKLQECQKMMDELEAELQRANNKVCHTGHLLNQMTVKVMKQLLSYGVWWERGPQKNVP